jgi:hypothetical protein
LGAVCRGAATDGSLEAGFEDRFDDAFEDRFDDSFDAGFEDDFDDGFADDSTGERARATGSFARAGSALDRGGVLFFAFPFGCSFAFFWRFSFVVAAAPLGVLRGALIKRRPKVISPSFD